MSVLRGAIEVGNRIFCNPRFTHRIPKPAGGTDIWLNLGCGLTVAKRWINIDGSINALIATMPKYVHHFMYRWTGANRYYTCDDYCRILGGHTFVHHDLRHGLPCDDAVAGYIYSSHFLEHLERSQAAALIADCYRVLKPGGAIRLSVPDLEYAVQLYHAGRKAEMLENYFFVESGGSRFAQHRYMYDFAILSEVLRYAGFRNIARCTYRTGMVPDLGLLDNRAEDSLFVEARK